MTPEELNGAYRDFVYERMPQYAAASRSLLLEDDPIQLTEFVLQHGSYLAKKGLLDESEALRMDKVFMAAYKNTALETFIFEFNDTIEQDERAAEIIRMLNFKPEMVSPEDFRYVFDTYFTADVYVTPMLEILLSDPDFRQAMDLEDGVTVAKFKERTAELSRYVNTYDDFQKAARQYSYFGPFIPSCGPTVCVVAIVFIITFSKTVGTPVTCASGSTCLPSVADMVPLQRGKIESICRNETSRPVWLIVPGHSGYRRAVIAPGETSLDLGLRRIDAIIIGGPGNAVTSFRSPENEWRSNGCYVLGRSSSSPSDVTLADCGDGIEIKINDAQQAAEAAGLAGYSSLEGGAIASYADARFAMDGAAALLPANADRRRLFHVLAVQQRHDRALRLSNWFKTFRMTGAALT